MRRMTIIGILLIVAGLVIGVGLISGGIAWKSSKDPASSNEKIITSSGGELELGSGTHLIWIKDDVSGPITVIGPNNVTYTIERSSETAEYGDISLWGEFEAETAGGYRFEYIGTGDLYITEDFSMGPFSVMMFGGGGAGLLVLVIGVILLIVGIIRQKSMDQSSFFQEAPPPGPETKQGTIDKGAGGH